MLSQSDRERITSISKLLYEASRGIRILGHLNWPKSVRYNFFRSKSEKLPEIEYPRFDPDSMRIKIEKAKTLMGDTPYDDWLRSKTQDLNDSLEILECRGSKEFFRLSSNIYGTPKTVFRDGKTTPLILARKFIDLLDVPNNDITKNKHVPGISSEKMKSYIQKRVRSVFGKQAPKVIVVDGISAKATANSRSIKLRKGAKFTNKDIEQLVHHEAMIHVATTLNGRAQDKMKILGANYGAITKTQEGLAVFAEFITGCIDIERMKRIVNRVVAIQMAIDGANFIDVYRWFLERVPMKTEAFENTRRVFRGGVLSGSAPFTKDIVYLDGFIRVYNFFRTAVSRGRQDILQLFFSGKLKLDDLPILIQMEQEGLIRKPLYIPSWLSDMDYLICYFSLSVFLDDINYDNVDAYYDYL